MSKSGNFGMAVHQALGFSGLMMRIPKSEAIFWPGCALMNLDTEILEKTLEILRRAESEIKLAAGCCSQPTMYLFPEKSEKRQMKLRNLLKEQGVKRIYTACPNCTLQLRELGDFEVYSIWPVLAECLDQADVETLRGSFVWHDPCPTRKDLAQQAAVRQILTLGGYAYMEPDHSGEQTRCCGNFHMLRTTDPEKSEKMRKNRLAELDSRCVIASSCEGCLDAFRSEGRETCHLLELLFGKSKSRGWANRIKTTKKAPII